MMLSKRESNIFYEAIIGSNLDPADFKLENTDDRVLITHNSGSTFEFSKTVVTASMVERTTTKMFYPYQVRLHVVEGISEDSAASTIDQIATNSFPVWLHEIDATVGAPNYWDEMQHGLESISVTQREDFDNTPFTEDEQRQIAAQLQEIIKELSAKFDISSEQVELIAERLDEAAEASKRMGRKDWLIYFLGTLTALIITATVTAGVGEHIFSMVIHDIAHLFTGGNEPPQIPPQVIT